MSACASCDPMRKRPRQSKPNAYDVSAQDASRSSKRSRGSSMRWMPWSSRQAEAIRNRLCVGPARAFGVWPTNCSGRVSRSRGRKSPSCSRASDTVFRLNRKTREGNQHPDRNAQFEYIAKQVRRFQKRGQPVISVDTKKKELVGNFKNVGKEWCPQGKPTEVKVHDFVEKKLGKAIPYGVYDLTANAGWVSVGTDHDTADFAVATIRRWWRRMGCGSYSNPTELLITADGGGSNSSRNRRWKVALQELADELHLAIRVCHFPPGTSKWNKIEHRLFSQIGINWRGRPLVSHEVVVRLIAKTTTATGLRVRAAVDKKSYPTGVKVTNDELANVNLRPSKFHGEWNYTIRPSGEKL
jgi:hypothetical protein